MTNKEVRQWYIAQVSKIPLKDQKVEDLRNRDLKVYGNRNGPTFEFLVEKARKLGLIGDRIYAAIIEDSWVTNAEINERFED